MEKAIEHNVQWKKVKLGGVIMDSYAGGTPNRSHDDYFGGEIPWVTSGEVNNPLIYSTLESITFAKGTKVMPNAFKDCSSDLIVRKSSVSTIKVADNEIFTENVQNLNDATNLGTLLTSTYVDKYWKFD